MVSLKTLGCLAVCGVLVGCVTPSQPPPPVQTPRTHLKLSNPAEESLWIEVPVERVSGMIGTGTGYLDCWYRFQIVEPRIVHIGAHSQNDVGIGVSLFNDSPVRRTGGPPLSMDYALHRDATIDALLKPDVYYIEVWTTGARLLYALTASLEEKTEPPGPHPITPPVVPPVPPPTPPESFVRTPPLAQQVAGAGELVGSARDRIGSGERYWSRWYHVTVPTGSVGELRVTRERGNVAASIHDRRGGLIRYVTILRDEGKLRLEPGSYLLKLATVPSESASFAVRLQTERIPVSVSIPVPKPPELAEPGTGTATEIRSDERQLVAVGGSTGLRWQWRRIHLASVSRVTVNVSVTGAPASVQIIDGRDNRLLETIDVDLSTTRSYKFPAGDLLVKIVTRTSASSAVQLNIHIARKSSDAGFIPRN